MKHIIEWLQFSMNIFLGLVVGVTIGTLVLKYMSWLWSIL